MTNDNQLNTRTIETSGSGNRDVPPARRTVILGLGNPIMGDDGIGLVALERLRALDFTPPVTLVDGGTWGLALLGDVEAADSLLLLDALDIGASSPPSSRPTRWTCASCSPSPPCAEHSLGV